MDLIGVHPSRFVVTEHVAAEITDLKQRNRYSSALIQGQIVEERVDDPVELHTFINLALKGRLGAGERSAIAIALNRDYNLAIEDNRAISRALREARLSDSALSIVRTQDLIVDLIRDQTITVERADAMLADWAQNHRFRLKISTFKELL